MAAPSVNYAKAAAMAPQPAAPMPQQHHMQHQQMPPKQPGGGQGGDYRNNVQPPPKDNRLKTTVSIPNHTGLMRAILSPFLAAGLKWCASTRETSQRFFAGR